MVGLQPAEDLLAGLDIVMGHVEDVAWEMERGQREEPRSAHSRGNSLLFARGETEAQSRENHCEDGKRLWTAQEEKEISGDGWGLHTARLRLHVDAGTGTHHPDSSQHTSPLLPVQPSVARRTKAISEKRRQQSSCLRM